MENTAKKTLGIIFGGRSSEHEVSLRSATMIINNVPKDKYSPVLIGITKEGKWYLYEGDVSLIADGSWEQSGSIVPAFISPDPTAHGLLVMRGSTPETIYLDAVFPVLHGKNGEDGTMQGLLELAGIPYVGCDTASAAVCMDKAITNTMLELGKVPQARFVWFYYAAFEREMEEYLSIIEDYLSYPCFVKPANAGSSVGISKCKNRSDAIDAIRFAAMHDSKIVVEQAIKGTEVEIAVLGSGDFPRVSEIGEIVSANEWYDYESKYSGIGSKTLIPARISKAAADEIKHQAIRAYRILGCSGLARIDFFVKGDEIFLNEPNTLPGFTEISMYPTLWEASGVSNGELIDTLVTLAEERMATAVHSLDKEV
ncbi:MAG: D-alanine--D-alanine ligase [Oscillospiraceae bacterium]|jgi:D-alanine-D-alanine ligase|nr:D-alanine--D-alanine ligase [Oscillospiraceae bacterium]